jgi:hypothetical protein
MMTATMTTTFTMKAKRPIHQQITITNMKKRIEQGS